MTAVVAFALAVIYGYVGWSEHRQAVDILARSEKAREEAHRIHAETARLFTAVDVVRRGLILGHPSPDLATEVTDLREHL